MLFSLKWFEKDGEIILYIELYGHKLLFSDYFYAFFQYVCFIIVYLLIMKLIKDILNKDSDEYF